MNLPIESRDTRTHRRLLQWTRGPAAHWPLYYFIPSCTADGRTMIVHRQQGSDVQLARLDLQTGLSEVFTRAVGENTGWDIWCDGSCGGVYNHLSALNVAAGHVAWFENAGGDPARCQLRAADVATLQPLRRIPLPGRVPIGQNAFSPDGKLLAFIHADADAFADAIARHDWADHQAWRRSIDCTISLVDWPGGSVRTLIELDYHVHHVIFVDNAHVLVNHCPDGRGMWTIGVDGDSESIRLLRPADEHGRVCHQAVTRRGIYYEAFGDFTGRDANWIGCYHWPEDRWTEIPLPVSGYAHTGRDPAGRLLVFEVDGETHGLYALLDPLGEAKLELLSLLPPCPGPGQRGHAHPLLSPDRRWLYHTRAIAGQPQLCALDISDLSDREDSLTP
ncbi:MAG: hypothetical protein ACOCZE_06105 [Planctomycetota bacterium]